MQMPPSLMVALLTHWFRSGVASEIIRAIRNEAAARQQLATRFLKGIALAARPASHHLWMPLPKHLDGADLLAHLMRNGLAVVGEEAFAADRRRAARLARLARRRAQSRRAQPGAAGAVARGEDARGDDADRVNLLSSFRDGPNGSARSAAR